MPSTAANPEPIDLVLLGAGRWGTHLLRNFLNHPQIRLRAVVEASESRLAALADQLHGTGVKVISDWQAAMALEGVVGCAIATPAATHYKLIEAALEHNLHVLAEKPLTLDIASSKALCTLAAQQNRQLVIDHTYLFHSVVTTGKTALKNLGTPRYGYATRTHLGPVRQDVDTLWDLAIHDISIFNYWLGERPIKVQAQGSSWLQPQINTPLSPNGLADQVWCRLQYPSGFEATIHLCWANPDKQRRLAVVCDQATLIFDEMNKAAPLIQQNGSFTQNNNQFTPQNLSTQPVESPATEPLRKVCDHFVTCIQQNQPSAISSAEIGTQLVSVLAALSDSMKQNGEWISVVA
ncbi:Gfo/Idh/MocA family protein [cf. Phormidesmis sp. LEGE 11477]|uniref:Gfo/Idh/MocA family protein n=1 Tax=cf. Phormidesmis sp. LEGE 11477 TaxID=1828680 RepID=UPI00187E40D6|nr:Gfo/Idh/MocA family oxidoreductase [cf. Phormidesmis sp. LEGE 11477]MBE9064532.1 Gfo/Idh/MocA family oxidoreductase [cf. Phormidesmis sp. LEGE 11477]